MRIIRTITYAMFMALAPGVTFARDYVMPYLPPAATTVPIVILVLMMILGWRLWRKPRQGSWFFSIKTGAVAIIGVIAFIIVLVNFLDLFKAKVYMEQMMAYQQTSVVVRSARTSIDGFFREFKYYPNAGDGLPEKIPFKESPYIDCAYRLVSENVYEITARHKKWDDVEFMLRSDSANIYARWAKDAKSEFQPAEKLEKLLAERAAAASNPLSRTWHRVIGRAKRMDANVTVTDSDTKKPLWGAHVILGYHKAMKDSERMRLDERRECSGSTEGQTDREGNILLALEVDNCPNRGIEDEELILTVKDRGYATYHRPIKKKLISVALERLGYTGNHPPLEIEYPNYQVDIEKYKNNFELLNELNAREVGGKRPIKSYFAWEYSHSESFGEEGFSQFLEKIDCMSNVNAIPMLKEVLDKKYPLPNKRVKFSNEDSWKAGDYIYEIGRRHVAKALLNIADSRADSLLFPSTDIPEAYVQVLDDYRIALTSDDYWNYLAEKYVSRAHNRMIGQQPRPDPLLLVKSKLKERMRGPKYAEALFTLYQISAKNGADKAIREHYNWQVDQKRLAEELFEYNLPKFTSAVKTLLPGMEADSVTRKNLSYMYKQREYAYLAETLKRNRNLMKAFLAEDVKETMTWNKTNETKYLGIEECLLPKMPRVAAMIRNEIEEYLEETSVNYTFYRWWIRNLSMVNRRAADNISQEIYAKASIEPYKEHSKDEKQYALRGAAEGKLKGLCRTVYDDVLMKENLKRDYFSTAQERIYYLSSACPGEFRKIVKHFDVGKTKKQMARKNAFEPSYGYDLKDFRDSIWQGVEKYFPKQQAVKILGEYVCTNEEVLQGAYFGSNVLPERYPIGCLCERVNRDSQGPNKANVSHLVKYLDKCFPGQMQDHKRLQMIAWDREMADRNYQGFVFLVKGQQGYASQTQIHDKKFHAFFKAINSTSDKLNKGEIEWSVGLESDKALTIIQQALSSHDPEIVKPGLYASSFYPTKLSSDIIGKLREHVSLGKYPDYLYAAHSLANGNPDDAALQGICAKAADYHLNIIESRDLKRFERNFAFNAVLTLDVCSLTKEEQIYLKVLNALFEQKSAGRYDRFQLDIERIITSNNITVGQLIEKLTGSSNVIDIITGIRLAELKKYPIDSAYLGEKLDHDDSYVRLASAKYICANKARYMNLHKNLSNNTNRRVRDLSN